MVTGEAHPALCGLRKDTMGKADRNRQQAARLRIAQRQAEQAIIGSANHITAAICKVTNGQPGNVCKSTSVTSVGGSI
jgi:hypothetical protein